MLGLYAVIRTLETIRIVLILRWYQILDVYCHSWLNSGLLFVFDHLYLRVNRNMGKIRSNNVHVI